VLSPVAGDLAADVAGDTAEPRYHRAVQDHYVASILLQVGAGTKNAAITKAYRQAILATRMLLECNAAVESLLFQLESIASVLCLAGIPCSFNGALIGVGRGGGVCVDFILWRS